MSDRYPPQQPPWPRQEPQPSGGWPTPPPGYGPPGYQQPPPGYGPPGYQQPPPGYGPPGQYPPMGYAPRPQRKRRRVFLWVFFAVQAIFLIWIIGGSISAGHTAPSAAQMAQYCGHGPKSVLGLYQNRADCMSHYSTVLSDAAGVGRGLGVAFIVVLWVVVDFFLGLGYGIYRLATRPR